MNASNGVVERDYKDALVSGSGIERHVNSIVKGLCDKAFTTRVAGHAVPCVNSQAYQSEIGDELCARRPDAPFAAIWYAPDMTSRIWSLRSRNGFDVSAVAAAFGGGGHAAAASFRASLETRVAAPPEGYVPGDPESSDAARAAARAGGGEISPATDRLF